MSRIALVTGASSGIGLAIAQQLLGLGWRVIGVDRSAPQEPHPSYQHIQCDLLDGTAMAGLLDALPSPLHACIHAAGQMYTAPLGQLDPSQGQQMWALHVDVASRLANALLPPMQALGFGRMVLIGSRVARGVAGRSQYAACKAALVAMARSWAAEVVAQGVTVNVVSPAATRTGLLHSAGRQGTPPKTPPMGRLIEPQEVASMVAYLLSDAAAPVTGQDITLCGGSSL
ncbi:MAG: hypothetical protein RLZZ126_1712 [Pseudomonadota bacterium]|jgi:3-oxoacyl-[acyl-carrier protein] reductase